MQVKEFNRRVEYQGGADREFKEWRIIDIHETPRVFLERHEMDFYCCNGEKVFLLRLRNRKEEKYCVSNDKESQKLRYPPYLIAELPIKRPRTTIDDAFLESILTKFMKNEDLRCSL